MLSYSTDLSSDSPGSQIGTNAFVDVQVSLGSSVHNFDIINTGYGQGWRNSDYSKGGITGI